MIFRHAKQEELDEILSVYEAAKRFMEEHGNLQQWSGDDAVTRENLKSFLTKEQLYVGEENGQIQCVYAYILGEDPTYRVIRDGAWLNQDSYGTIHRLASAGRVRGVVKLVTEWALLQHPSLRIDTHADNLGMNQ